MEHILLLIDYIAAEKVQLNICFTVSAALKDLHRPDHQLHKSLDQSQI